MLYAGLVSKVATTVSASLSQQLVGPLRVRADARVALAGPTLLETSYGFDVALPPGGVARLVAWYCPQRKEAMAEVRFMES
jgi:hypothetical protein